MKALASILALSLVAAQVAAGAGTPAGGSDRVPILLYHQFGPTAQNEMTVRTGTFAWQLRYLRDHGYRIIRLRDYINYRRGLAPPPPPRSVVITADDGRQSVYTDMLPLARAYHVPVTLFIYPSAISNASYAMTWPELAALIHSGLFDVESHTYWHPNFHIEKARLNAQQYEAFVRVQLTRSKITLERRLGIQVDMLAWPFGIYDADLMRQASQAGYVAAFSIERRNAGPDDPPLALPRFIVTDADVGARFARLVGGIPERKVTRSGTEAAP